VGRSYIAVGLTVVLVAVSLVLARELAVTWATGGAGQPATMSLNVESPPGACDDADKPTTCSIPHDAAFTLAVVVNGLPVDPKSEQEAGYVAFQTQVFYGDLVYDPAATAADETVWPESALPVRSPAAPTGLEGIVAHGDASGVTPPLAPSGHTGNVVEIAFDCPAQPRSFKLALLPYDPVDRPLGAGFRLLDQETGELGQTVPAKIAGQQQLDLDGQPETVDVAAALTINCGTPPTSTPTPTSTLTATPTVTPTAAEMAPAAPTNLQAIVVYDALAIQLLWQDNADNEESYVVERSTAGAEGPWSVIATLPANGDSYFDSGLEDGVKYWYRVAAANEAGTSEYSNVVYEMATALPQPLIGDASCDGEVDAIDAALILQLNAGLIGTLPCEMDADVNGDGAVNAIDAALVLQYAAGLIDTLPP
jgi:hypothetical protein